jgi:AraC family transcriptional regulator, transcriptional activator of pobA
MSKPSEYVPIHHIKTKEMNPLGFGLINLVDKGAYDSSVPHRHTFFELFYFAHGSGIHEIDFNKFPVESNSAHFVAPGQIHKLSLKNTQGYVLCFTEDFVSLKNKENFIEKFPFFASPGTPCLKLNDKLAKEFLTLVRSISNDLSTLQEGPDIIRSYLNIILLKLKQSFSLSEKSGSGDAQSRKQKVTAFKKLINDRYLKHLPVSDYADALHVSPNHLNALCKKHEGKTATGLIQERMILESKRLLYASEMNIKEISFYLNFEDVPYFNRFFKKHTGLTPIQYRQTIHK